MEIVIDIPKATYESINKYGVIREREHLEDVIIGIQSAIILPYEHGSLIDRDELKDTYRMPEIKKAKVLVPYKIHLSSDCPNCGRNIYDYLDVNYEEECNEYYKITNFHPYFDGEFSGHEWTVECVCPYCNTEFSFIDGDI